MLNKRQKNQRFVSYTFLEKNRKAQVGEIVTWIVATLIIIVVLITFIYASSILAQKTKIIKVKNLKIGLEEEADWLETKTSLTYSLASEENKQIIDTWGGENE